MRVTEKKKVGMTNEEEMKSSDDEEPECVDQKEANQTELQKLQQHKKQEQRKKEELRLKRRQQHEKQVKIRELPKQVLEEASGFQPVMEAEESKKEKMGNKQPVHIRAFKTVTVKTLQCDQVSKKIKAQIKRLSQFKESRLHSKQRKPIVSSMMKRHGITSLI